MVFKFSSPPFFPGSSRISLQLEAWPRAGHPELVDGLVDVDIMFFLFSPYLLCGVEGNVLQVRVNQVAGCHWRDVLQGTGRMMTWWCCVFLSWILTIGPRRNQMEDNWTNVPQVVKDVLKAFAFLAAAMSGRHTLQTYSTSNQICVVFIFRNFVCVCMQSWNSKVMSARTACISLLWFQKTLCQHFGFAEDGQPWGKGDLSSKKIRATVEYGWDKHMHHRTTNRRRGRGFGSHLFHNISYIGR